MSEKAKAAVEIFGKHVGTSDGYSEWIEVDQKRINLFADATLIISSSISTRNALRSCRRTR